jgi:hypothetical protein
LFLPSRVFKQFLCWCGTINQFHAFPSTHSFPLLDITAPRFVARGRKRYCFSIGETSPTFFLLRPPCESLWRLDCYPFSSLSEDPDASPFFTCYLLVIRRVLLLWPVWASSSLLLSVSVLRRRFLESVLEHPTSHGTGGTTFEIFGHVD